MLMVVRFVDSEHGGFSSDMPVDGFQRGLKVDWVC